MTQTRVPEIHTKRYVTLINTFTVKPGQQHAFIDAQIRAHSFLKEGIPGAVSTSFHRSLDDKKVINYSQFESLEAYSNWRDSELFKSHAGSVSECLIGVDPVLAEVVFLLNPASPTTQIVPQRYTTLINVFDVKPENQQRFIEVQTEEYRRLDGKIPGSVSANLHRSLDGTKVVNYAQFESVEAYAAWRSSDLFREHVNIIRPYIEGFDPTLAEVVFAQTRENAR